MKKIASDLQSLMAEIVDSNRTDVAADYPAARDQLRAVLAVVKAALGPEAVQPSGCWGYDMKTKTCRCQMHRAVAALLVPERKS